MAEINPLLIIVGLAVVCYLFVPAFHDKVGSFFGQKNVTTTITQTQSSYAVPGVYTGQENLTTQSNVTNGIDPNIYSVVGFPEKTQEFNCRYDRDCAIYNNACTNQVCVCLSDGSCAIKVGGI